MRRRVIAPSLSALRPYLPKPFRRGLSLLRLGESLLELSELAGSGCRVPGCLVSDPGREERPSNPVLVLSVKVEVGHGGVELLGRLPVFLLLQTAPPNGVLRSRGNRRPGPRHDGPIRLDRALEVPGKLEGKAADKAGLMALRSLRVLHQEAVRGPNGLIVFLEL